MLGADHIAAKAPCAPTMDLTGRGNILGDTTRALYRGQTRPGSMRTGDESGEPTRADLAFRPPDRLGKGRFQRWCGAAVDQPIRQRGLVSAGWAFRPNMRGTGSLGGRNRTALPLVMRPLG
jgi:hypothetical protein